MNKKMLIIGNSVKESALARKLVEKHDVFVITGKDKKTEYAKPSAGVFQDYHFNFSNKNISKLIHMIINSHNKTIKSI